MSAVRLPLFAVMVALGSLFSARVAADSAPADSAPAEKKVPPPFDAEPFSAETSPAPTKAEWANAPLVTLSANMSSVCAARRLREWIHLRCDHGNIGVIRLLGGKRDGLQTRLVQTHNQWDEPLLNADLVIPVRRGDSRVIEVMAIEFGYKGSMSVTPWLTLSEHWPDEDEKPTISTHHE